MEDLFRAILDAEYKHTENDGDFAIERIGKNIWFFFQWSNSKIDWKNNFDFPAKPYRDMGTNWYCHRGFLKVWKSIEPEIEYALRDYTIENVVIAGYSHGGAIATLCHEYVWFNKPELRNKLHTYVFGSPRVYWGWFMNREIKRRWENLHIIRNGKDIVTYLPPALFGFRHVNKVIKLNPVSQVTHSKIKCVNYHYPDNYISSLEGDYGESK